MTLNADPIAPETYEQEHVRRLNDPQKYSWEVTYQAPSGALTMVQIVSPYSRLDRNIYNHRVGGYSVVKIRRLSTWRRQSSSVRW